MSKMQADVEKRLQRLKGDFLAQGRRTLWKTSKLDGNFVKKMQ